MLDKKIAILDYDIGNIGSITNAFNRIGVDVTLTLDESEIKAAPALVLPGVGQFTEAIRNLHRSNLVNLLCDLAKSGKPMLGICLGMQLLMSSSEECDDFEGLNIIPGKARRFTEPPELEQYKIPQIGWNNIVPPAGNTTQKYWSNTVLEGLDETHQTFFLHSFMVVTDDPAHVISNTVYGGQSFCSTIRKDSVWGCQYHPEQSGRVGLKILENFVSLVRDLQA